MPFLRGELPDATSLQLRNPDGEVIPLAARPLVKWPDGSTRWALLAFEAQQTGPHALNLEGGGEPSTPLLHPVQVEDGPDSVLLDNGLVRVKLSRGAAGPIEEIVAHGQTLLSDAREFELRVDDASTIHEKARVISISESSPLRARVRVEGAHYAAENKRRLSYRLDIEVWAGWPTLRLDYHFFNLEAGSDELEISCIQAVFCPHLEGKLKRHFLQHHHGVFTQPREVFNPAPVAIRADKSRSRPYVEEWEMLLDDEQYPRYLINHIPETAPWLGVLGDSAGAYLQVQEFVDMRPGRISSEGSELVLDFWPEAAGSLTLPQGRSRRQSFSLGFPESVVIGSKAIQQLLTAPFHEGRAGVEHKWFRRCAAFEQDTVLEPGKNLRFEKYLRRILRLDTPQDIFDLGDTIEDDYTIGDIVEKSYTQGYIRAGKQPLKAGITSLPNPMLVQSTHGVEFAGEERFEPAWSNNEYDVLHALSSEIMRNTRHDLWGVLRQFARHNIEVDFVHYSDDPWQHHGSPAHSAGHNYSSAYPSHMWTQGLLEYYCLTGDADALEVAIKLGDTILRNFHDPVRGKLLEGFNREVGWPVLALVHLADITGEERFWKQLHELAEYLIAFDREGDNEPIKLSGVNPRHSMDRQIAGSFFGYASMVEGLYLYARLKNHEPLRLWLADLLLRLKTAWWQTYSEGRGVDGRCVQGMAIGYELTGDEDFLDLGMVALEELTDSPGWHYTSRSTKSVATSYRAYIRFLHHAQQAGLLQGMEYPALQKRNQAHHF